MPGGGGQRTREGALRGVEERLVGRRERRGEEEGEEGRGGEGSQEDGGKEEGASSHLLAVDGVQIGCGDTLVKDGDRAVVSAGTTAGGPGADA